MTLFRRALSVIVVLIAAVLILSGFVVLWAHEALSVTIQSGTKQNVTRSSATSVAVNTTIDIQNNFPAELTFTYYVGGYGSTANEMQTYHPILISSNSKQLYAGRLISGPDVVQLNRTFSSESLSVPAFTESVVGLNWSYNYTRGVNNRLYVGLALNNVAAIPIYGLFPASLRVFPWFYAVPFVLIFVGGILAALALWDTFRPLLTSLKELFDPRKKNPDQLKPALNDLSYTPNTLGFGLGTLLAPCITILKIIINRDVTARNYKLRHGATNDDPSKKNPYDIFLDNPATQPASTLLELRTVGLVLGLLTSLGLTFSWNIGAIAPIVLSAGIAYLLYNMGTFAFVLGKKGLKYQAVTLSVLAVIAVVLAGYDAIAYLRTYTLAP